ncbi:MAG TPA: cytochrome c-type biogenesis protein [Rhizomicrobium sp.]|nr:cytochrome c-type biogenesis protein [Rhizomicrobium sp.]
MLLGASSAHAVLPNEQLADPKLEARARAISEELRCVVCQNQSIDDSDAELAHDLRVLLRERLLRGDTDEQAKAYIVKRYGSYVLLKPQFRTETLLLWLGPFVVLMLGGAGATVYILRRRATENVPLSLEEERRASAMLESEEPLDLQLGTERRPQELR